MAILRIKNQTQYKISVPVVDVRLVPYGTRSAEIIDVDTFFNDPRIQSLMSSSGTRPHPAISVEITQDSTPSTGAVSFDAAWDTTDPLRLEPYQTWIDIDGNLRLVSGTPTSDTDGYLVGKTTYTAAPIFEDVVNVDSKTFANVRGNFFNWWSNSIIGTWDDLYKYCYWSFSTNLSTIWSEPQQFATENDLFLWLEANIPSAGGVYTAGEVRFKLYELEDPEESFPKKIVHRNSLVASMAGRARWRNKKQTCYGVAGAFNTPMYYSNFYNELGQRFVEAATGVVPATNNDDCVWYPRASHSLWQLNRNYIEIGGTSRGAAWDSVALSWVSPAPSGYYTTGTPFFLYEDQRNGTLATDNNPNYYWRDIAINSVCALVFPVVLSGRYYGFVVYPHNGDSWSTEWFDTALYETVLKLSYRGSFRDVYRVIQPWPGLTNNNEQLMWSHFDPTGLGSLLALRTWYGGARRATDTNTVPTHVYVAKRDKRTGVRSKWKPLYNIKRRLNNGDIRVLPAGV